MVSVVLECYRSPSLILPFRLSKRGVCTEASLFQSLSFRQPIGSFGFPQHARRKILTGSQHHVLRQVEASEGEHRTFLAWNREGLEAIIVKYMSRTRRELKEKIHDDASLNPLILAHSDGQEWKRVTTVSCFLSARQGCLVALLFIRVESDWYKNNCAFLPTSRRILHPDHHLTCVSCAELRKA